MSGIRIRRAPLFWPSPIRPSSDGSDMVRPIGAMASGSVVHLFVTRLSCREKCFSLGRQGARRCTTLDQSAESSI